MKKWPTKPLAEAYWFQEGPGVRKWQFRNSGIKLLNVANITKEGTLDLSKTDKYLSKEEVSEKYSHFLADAGDLVIASSGISFDDDGLLRTRGAFVESKHQPLCINTSTIRFKPKDGISTLAWLRYWLDSREFREQITRLVTGSAQQNFGPSHLKATKITLPALAEQERIVKLLDEADKLRKLRAQADRRNDALVSALFHEMFGDPAKNPHKWPKTTLGEACQKLTDGTHFSPPATDAGVPYITAKHLREYGLDFDRDPTYVSPKHHREIYARCDPKLGDVLYIKDGVTTGLAAVNRYRFEFSMLSSLALMRPDPAKCESEFLCAWLNDATVKASMLGQMAGAAIRRLTLVKLNKAPILLPPLLLQRRFAQRVTEICELEARQAISRTRLDALFQSMLHRAFNGQL